MIATGHPSSAWAWRLELAPPVVTLRGWAQHTAPVYMLSMAQSHSSRSSGGVEVWFLARRGLGLDSLLCLVSNMISLERELTLFPKEHP